MAEITLTELVQTGDTIFLDASSALHYRGNPIPTNIEEERECSSLRAHLLARLRSHVEHKAKIYTTTDIIEELFAGELSTKYLMGKIKVLRENGTADSEQNARLEYFIQKQQEAMERLEFFKTLTLKGHIIKSGGRNGEAPGEGVSLNHPQRRSYGKLGENLHWLQKKYGLSRQDFDLIRVGLVWSTSTETPVTIVSNDKGIRWAIGEVSALKRKYQQLRHASRERPFAFEYSNGYH